MKIKLFIPLLGFMAFLMAVSCTEPIEVNPNYNSETKEVTTQFVLNLNTGSPQTKMTADVVQMNSNFRGIENAKLYVFKTNITSGTPYILNTSATAEKYFDFGKFFAADALDNSGNNNQNGANATASKRVLQLSIPVGVDAVLFYGRAAKAGGAEKAEVGATNEVATTFSPTPDNTVIAAEKILTNEKVDSYDATARLMIAVINDILSRGIDADPNSTFGELPAVTWAQYGHQYEIDHFPSTTRYNPATSGIAIGHTLEGLEEILGQSYYLFTYILPADATIRPNGEYRAGSSAAMKKMTMDMYKVISAASTATPTTANEANAHRLARVILDRANLYFNTDTSDQIPDGDYKTIDEIKSLLVTSYHIYSPEEWTTQFGKAADLNGYPFQDFGVPEGAAQLGFHYQGETVGGTTYTKDEFYYYHPNHPLVNPTMTEFEPRKYLYPAELWYYVNSPIRTTNSDVTVASYPDGVTPWNTDANWTGWTFPGKVEGSTRGVAVVNSINYAVAMLKTSVKFKEGVSILQDNRKALSNNLEENKTIAVSNDLFELRGVLVGGVNPRMGWQFTRKYTETGNHEGLGDLSLFDGVIYDHSMASNVVPTPTAPAKPNYTLVYDNYNSTGGTLADQNDVYVALEFVNKGEDFYGRDNMIPSGGVFYLVAKLDKPTAEQAAALNWPTDHQIPPIYTSGENAGQSMKIGRVFIQDFVTNATFQITATSLQKAYYSVPDLRASQMSLGLSVDLQWIPGLNYTLDL